MKWWEELYEYVQQIGSEERSLSASNNALVVLQKVLRNIAKSRIAESVRIIDRIVYFSSFTKTMNDPVSYAKVNLIARKCVSDFTAEFADEIGKSSGRCLDIGSGPSDVAVDFILPKLNPKATLVCSDISDAMVAFGKEKYKGNRRVSFTKLDIESLKLPRDLTEQFDQVTSTYCLHWCHDMRHVFKNVFDLLRPGGNALLIFIANFPAMTAFEKLATMPRYQPYMQNADRYTPAFQKFEHQQEALEASVEDVGFKVRHCSVREKCFVYEDADVFAKFIVAINPFIERIPAELKEEYRKDLIKEATRRSIVLNKDNNDQHENAILCKYRSCVLHLQKPLIN